MNTRTKPTYKMYVCATPQGIAYQYTNGAKEFQNPNAPWKLMPEYSNIPSKSKAKAIKRILCNIQNNLGRPVLGQLEVA